MYPYGLVGNCQAAALIHDQGSVDWLCFPRPDSPPIFGKLLDPEGGHFSITLKDLESSSQCYVDNTNILVTTLRSKDGSEVKVTDFFPRFLQHGRIYRPCALFRIVEPVAGSPTIEVSCRPVNGWDKTPLPAIRGNQHLRYDVGADQLRLLTNMPLTYLTEESAFRLKEPLHFALSWGLGIEDDLVRVAHSFLEQTRDYWQTWVKHCSIPSLYQGETIRSALILKLHCYEDTGAILAALTTSLPEELGSERNWDYRFCWLRDAYYVLSAFHNLGHFEEMEGFIKFLLNVAEKYESSHERLSPVYRLDQSLPLPELTHPQWAGFGKSAPVRSGNQAAEHIQNDVYGEMVLTLSPIYFDERFMHLRSKDHEGLVKHLARLCAQNISSPDAGLWELRDGWQEHSFSNLMCWAGLDRVQKLRERGFLKSLSLDVKAERARAEAALMNAVHLGALTNGPSDPTVDASLLQLPILRFPDAGLCLNTVERIWKELRLADGEHASAFLYRYLRKDDFGQPQSSFVICSFWLVQALARVGEIAEARRVMKEAVRSGNRLGLFAEHYFPQDRIQAGNFPQAYSHVGQINAAFAISPSWSEVL